PVLGVLRIALGHRKITVTLRFTQSMGARTRGAMRKRKRKAHRARRRAQRRKGARAQGARRERCPCKTRTPFVPSPFERRIERIEFVARTSNASGWGTATERSKPSWNHQHVVEEARNRVGPACPCVAGAAI